MSEIPDLRPWLEAWPYDEDHNVRKAVVSGGREVLQVRTPLGLEQYELQGRPDGLRPYGCESALDYHRARRERALAEGKGAKFRLTAPHCAELFAEGALFYFRYLHLFQIKDWTRTARDTARNLGLFDFVREHATREIDRMQLEKWRPYILRMNAIARAMLEMEADHHAEAIEIVQHAQQTIEALPELNDDTFRFERERSLMALREVAEQLRETRPISPLERLEQELQQAISTQAFERAAVLRDQIRALRREADRGPKPAGSGS